MPGVPPTDDKKTPESQHEENSQAHMPKELTQTDKLNKKLLMSLLDRLNQGDATLQQMMQSSDSEDDNDEWETAPQENPPPKTS